MLSKFIIALIALFTGIAATHFVHSKRAANFQHIARLNANTAELKGYEEGWKRAYYSPWVRQTHYNSYKKELEEAIAD